MAYDVEQWIRSWSPGSGPTKGESVGALYTADAERWDIAIDSHLTGRDAMVAFADGFIGAMPDSVCELRNSAQDGDTVLIEWTWRGTHTGDSADWPARGESVVLVGCNVLRLSEDGLIRSETSYWDRAALFGA